MAETADVMEALDARVRRREERRDFFKAVLGTAAVGAGAFAFSSSAAAQAVTDTDILNFALQLEYLEAQFYSYAFNGRGLDGSLLTGSGNQGAVVTSGANPPRAVDFSGEPLIGQYAREIASDERAHVAFLRRTLGTSAASQPAINISGNATGPFTSAAVAAGVFTQAQVNNGAVFDPYASPDNFLLAAFIFEDVGVTAYKGASPLVSNNAYLDAAAGILAAEAFHAGIIRGALYSRGVNNAVIPGTNNATLRTATDRISDARDSLDGAAASSGPPQIAADDDQGVSPLQVPITSANGTTTDTASNIVPTDGNGVTFSRTTGQVLNVVYLNRSQVTMGGFFPAGVNGNIRTSAAN